MKKPLIAWIAGGLLLLAGIAFGLGLFSQTDDKTQIRNALDRALRASKEGRPGGVLELISADFELNQNKFSSGQIAQKIKEMKPNVEVESREPVISGDTAKITSPVNLSLSLPPVQMRLSKTELDFQREDTRRLLFFPAKDWKLVKVTIPEEVYEEVSSQFGGGF